MMLTMISKAKNESTIRIPERDLDNIHVIIGVWKVSISEWLSLESRNWSTAGTTLTDMPTNQADIMMSKTVMADIDQHQVLWWWR